MIKNYFKLIVALVFASNVLAQNVPSYVPTNGLVGYWPFNGNANDESGNGNNGTVNGATLTSDRGGKANSAYSFDGVKDFISLTSTKKEFNSISVSVWYTIEEEYDINTKGMHYLIDCRKYNSDPSIFINANDNYFQTFCGDKFMSLGIKKWHNIICVKNNEIIEIYIDGNLINNNQSSTILNLNDEIILGKRFSHDEFLKGQLDDIAIYNRALTQQEITALYTGTPVAQNIPSYVPINGLVGYWPFNGNANDESGNGNNLIISGPKLSFDRKGNSNSSYYFNGIDNYLYTSSIGFPTKERTVSIWYNINNANEQPTILGYGGSSICGTSWFQGINTEKSKSFVIAGHCKVNEIVKGYSEDQITNWHHLVVTNDINGKNIFLDGKLIASDKIFINNTVNSNNTHFAIGVNVSAEGVAPYTDVNSYWTKGHLDDIAIYNRALTQQEITALYNGSNQSALASTKVFVDAPATVNQNQEVELSISTEALNTTDNVIAYQTDLSYDPTRYTFVGSNLAGTLNANGSVDINTSNNGLLKIGYMSQTVLNGAGSLVKLKFKANNTLGQGVFGLSNFLYNTVAVSSLKNDTINTIDVTPPTARINYSQNPVRKGDSLLITVKFNEKMAVSPVPQLNLSGQNTLPNTNLTKVDDTTYTFWWVVEKGNGDVNVTLATGQDLGGNVIVATPTQNPSFTVLPTVFGDIDTNTLVQAYDAALALQYSVGLNPLPTMDPLPWSNWRIAVANVDTVGNVTANDASLILQKSIGKIAAFPADAKKRGGDAPVANVTVTQEGNQLVFRATGTLYAFNVFMKDNFNVLGQPVVKNKSAMLATNINATTYNVGLASTKPFIENEPFLVIPILTNENVQGAMDIVANTEEKSLSYGKAASISSLNKEVVLVYPNPTKDVVTINNAQGKTLRIVDVQGKEVYNQKVTTSTMELSMKTLGSKGMYVLHIVDANNESVQTKQIVLE